MTKHSLYSVQEPGTHDISRALFVAVFMSRELLSTAERSLTSLNLLEPVEAINSAISHLQASDTYLKGALSRQADEALLAKAKRAIHAAEAALSQVQRFGIVSGDDSESDAYNTKTFNIGKRATETARKDAHKLLVAVMERFPDSYDKDDYLDAEKEAQEDEEVR